MNASTNHPNRPRRTIPTASPCRNPSAEEIFALRSALGLTQAASAELVCYTLRAWQFCEAGQRKMHPGIWQLFGLKTLNMPRPPRPAAEPVQPEPAAAEPVQPDPA
jgi:putative transcriptional regulator